MPHRHRLTALALLLLVTACSGIERQAPAYAEPPTDGLRPGGGLLTGDDGEFVVFRR